MGKSIFFIILPLLTLGSQNLKSQTPASGAQTAGAAAATAIARLPPADTQKVADCNKNPTDPPLSEECRVLKLIGGNQTPLSSNAAPIERSSDWAMSCGKPTSYTADYEECITLLKHYNTVLDLEKAMDIQQKIRTNEKNKNLQQEVASKSSGDLQQSTVEAAIKNQQHMKEMSKEKVYAYSSAVTWLGLQLKRLSNEKDIIKKICHSQNLPENLKKPQHTPPKEPSQDQAQWLSTTCPQIITKNSKMILANSVNRSIVKQQMINFLAKGTAAGVAWDQHEKTKKILEENKKKLSDNKNNENQNEMVMDKCMTNPFDPSCPKPEERITNEQTLSSGTFSLGGSGENNVISFDQNNPSLGPKEENPLGSNSSAESSPEAAGDFHSPFSDEVKVAKDILNPAAPAEINPGGGGGGASPGGGGGGGGGLGGGSSLGKDLNQANNQGDSEGEVKIGKIKDTYDKYAANGVGFKGVQSSDSKEEANPFSSMFDQKDSSGEVGGIEEDRSIASTDIDEKTPDLFQKISKRYTLIHADKRIEARNFE